MVGVFGVENVEFHNFAFEGKTNTCLPYIESELAFSRLKKKNMCGAFGIEYVEFNNLLSRLEK